MSEKFSDDCYIVVSKYGIERMTKRRGTLKRGEIGVKVRLVLPTAVFDEPDVQATIVVPDAAIIKPDVEVTVLDPTS